MRVEHDRMILFEDYCVPADEFIPNKTVLVVTILIPGKRTMEFHVNPVHTGDIETAMMWMWHYAIFLSDLRHLTTPSSDWTWHVQSYRKLMTKEGYLEDDVE